MLEVVSRRLHSYEWGKLGCISQRVTFTRGVGCGLRLVTLLWLIHPNLPHSYSSHEVLEVVSGSYILMNEVSWGVSELHSHEVLEVVGQLHYSDATAGGGRHLI